MNYIKNIFLYTILLLVLILSSCFTKAAREEQGKKREGVTIRLYAAAGTRIASDEVCDLFEQNTSFRVERNYASSGTLARQIANGAEADVFISANKQWIDYLVKQGFLEENSVRVIAGTTLAVIAPLHSTVGALSFSSDFDILAAVRDRIAIGDPSYVPVGKYSKKAFEKLGWFDLLQEKMIMAKDVSAVLHYVELGECDWGIVYYTEALQSKKVRIIGEVPENLHNPIRFYAANVTGQKEAGKLLTARFAGPFGREIIIKHGFRPVQE